MYRGDLDLPGWIDNGLADAARQILTSIAAAIITVIGMVFSITIVALTLASTQFGPRILRNFIRDRGTQLTLGAFVATFVYVVLVLGSIGPARSGDFVPHLSISASAPGPRADRSRRARLLHPPHGDLDPAAAGDRQHRPRPHDGDRRRDGSPRPVASDVEGMSESEIARRKDETAAIVRAPNLSGYLQFIRHPTLVAIAADADAVIRLPYRPGHFVVEGRPLAHVWPPDAANHVAEAWSVLTPPAPTARSPRTSRSRSTSSSRSRSRSTRRE